MLPTFTIGIEEEYQTVDPVTRDLRSHIHAEIIEKGKLLLQERVKAEMQQSVVEVGTSVCSNIKEAKEEVKKLRRDMIALARENGLRLASAATHPFADWRVQEITEDVRYKNIVEDLQLVARANLIFGLHVHIGVEDRETAIQLMNHARYFLPHILALSTNSPFWLGMDTGLKSYRCKVGIRVDQVRAATFLVSGLLGGFAGILSVGSLGAADPNSGLSYLLPAFAAAFLFHVNVMLIILICGSIGVLSPVL
jgi:carboxylate-amine ligase